MKFELTLKKFSEIQTDALAVYLFENEEELKGPPRDVDRVTGGVISSIRASKEFSGKLFDYIYVRGPQGLSAKWLFIFGVGKKENFSATVLRRLAGTMGRVFQARGFKNAALLKCSLHDSAEAAEAVVEGVILGQFEIDRYKTDKEKKPPLETIWLVGGDLAQKSAITQAIARGEIIAEAQNSARELINEPSNRMTPTILASRARDVAERFGLAVEVLEKEDAQTMGMEAFLSVARGSDEPAKIVVLRYSPKGTEHGSKTIGLVGKGITFDSGGLSLKSAEGMEKMKYDMSGAASVIAVMRALAQLQPKVKVVAVIPATENMPSGKALKPGDVVTSLSGKTIEVINTDAEGRLILADGLAYARQLGATHLIDMATLTGAVAVALGDVRAAALGNHPKWTHAVLRAAEQCGEKFWELPMDEEYGEQINSKIADLKNIGGRLGGVITAAKFLESFVGDTPWVHLDIAGTEWLEESKPYCSAGPTGVGIRTVIETLCAVH